MKRLGTSIGKGLDDVIGKIQITETNNGVTTTHYVTPTAEDSVNFVPWKYTPSPAVQSMEMPPLLQPIVNLVDSQPISVNTSSPSTDLTIQQNSTTSAATTSAAITDIATPTQSPTVAGSGTRETYIYNPYQIRNLLDDKVRYDLTFKDYKKIMKVGDVSDYFRIRNVLKSCNTEDDCMAQLTALY